MIKYKNWRENNMTDLQECRRKIDEIDNQMVELFESGKRPLGPGIGAFLCNRNITE